MPGALRTVGDDGGAAARCAICGAPAAGPCARCRRPVCPDCSVLTEGGARTWAICTTCDERGGRSLARAWLGLVGWLLGLVAVLAAVAALARACR